MLATVHNMKALKDKGARFSGPGRVAAVDHRTGDTFSADPADYWLHDEATPLRVYDADGSRALVLMRARGANWATL